MSQSSSSAGPSVAVLRAAVIVLLALTVAAAGLLALRAVDEMARPDLAGRVPPLFAPAVLAALGGLGLAAVVEGLARVAGRPVEGGAAPAARPAADAVTPAVDRLTAVVEQLRESLAGLAAPAPPMDAAHLDAAHLDAAHLDGAHIELTHVEPLSHHPEPTPVADGAAVDPYLSHFERMVSLLEEIRELSQLDEAGRQARGQAARERRKAGRLEEADLLIHRQAWGEAEALLTLLESLHPADEDVLARRAELDDARTSHRDAEWGQLARQVEDQMALSRYDEAAAAVAAFRASYPNHADAAGLAAQVTADRDAHVEAGVTALFTEIKTAVEARQWRMALDGCQRFLAKFPNHAKAERIRQQVRTVQRNAEIEERHEQEDRIREMARAGRFAEAADLCQDLLDRFPGSPQAGSLRSLLPKLRERSALAEAAVE